MWWCLIIIGPTSDYGASGKSAGAHDRPSFVQSQFGLEGTTGSNRTEGSDSHLTETDTSSKPASDQSTARGEDGWRPEDLSMSLHCVRSYSYLHERLLCTLKPWIQRCQQFENVLGRCVYF